MTSPGRAELDAADALVAVVGRLRVGTLRLPAAVDGASPSAVLAAVLVALHAEATADAAPAVQPGSAR